MPSGARPHGPDRNADQQEKRELQHHDDPGSNQGDLRIAQGSRRKQALDDELVGAV
jgi:hypothetical protein